jgi:hypothetical protein
MKKSTLFLLALAIMLPNLLTGCHKKDRNAEIPNVNGLYAYINSLDSLTRVAQIDSLSQVQDGLAALLARYSSHAATPEDKAILDSLDKISQAVKDYLRFCTDSQANLAVLRQDTKTVESDYVSGKMPVNVYVGQLMQDGQVLNNLEDQMADKRQKALEYVKNRAELVSMLTPLFPTEHP